MWIFNEKERLGRKFAGSSVVYAYSLEDTPDRMFGVRIPRESIKTAKHALMHAHKSPHHKHAATHKLFGRDELKKVAKQLDKAARSKRSDHYFVGPSAVHVGSGLAMGADILGELIGKEVLVIQNEVLTNHQYVDICRHASRQ